MDQNWGDFILQLFTAGKGHQWIILGGLICTGIVRLLRLPIVLGWVPWFGTDRGGATLAAIVSLLATVAAALAGGTIQWATILDGVVMFMLAVGGFVIPKKLTAPSDQKTAGVKVG